MPSLLDMHLARQYPQLRGLFQSDDPAEQQAGPQAPPAPAAPQFLQGGGAPAQPQQAPQQAPPPPQPQGPDLQAMLSEAAEAIQPKPTTDNPNPTQRLDARETLLNTGLALLGGGGKTTFAQALTVGVLAGRQAAAQSNELRAAEAAAQQRAQKYMQVFGDGPITRETIDKAIKVAAIDGETETLDVLKDIRGQIPEDEREKWTAKDLGGTLVFTNDQGVVHNADGERISAAELGLMQGEDAAEFTPQIIAGQIFFTRKDQPGIFDAQGNSVSNSELPSEEERVRPVFRKRVDENGNEIEFAVDPFTLQPIPGSEQVTNRPTSTTDNFGPLLQRELANIRNVIGDDPNTPQLEGAEDFRALTSRFGALRQMLPNYMKPADLQQLNSAVGNIVSVIVKQRSGAAFSAKELEWMQDILQPKSGDTREAVEDKIRRLEALAQTAGSQGVDAATDPFLQAARQFGTSTPGTPPPPGSGGDLGTFLFGG